jgi:Spy/CpxP family protein refolding chaperone
MKTPSLLSIAFGLAILVSLAPAASARQDASAPQTPPPSAAPSGSQSGAGPGGGKHGHMDADRPEDDAALNLTDDQKSKIASIRSDTKDQLKAINKDTTTSDTDKQTKLKELRKTTRAQVWAVLTPDQQKQWTADARAKREEKRTGSAPE